MITLYSLVKDQFPEFVDSDYPAFVEFIQAYYKWLETQSVGKIEDVVDIDSVSYLLTIEQYDNYAFDVSLFDKLEIVGETSGATAVVKSTSSTDSTIHIVYTTVDRQFTAGEVIHVVGSVNTIKAQIAADGVHSSASRFVQNFKQQLDVYGTFNDSDPFSTRYLKNIKEIYASKGSEQALVFLLEKAYNTKITITYPGDQVLRASDGRWIQEWFITTNVVQGSLPNDVTQINLQIGESYVPINITRYVAINNNLTRFYYKTPYPIVEGQLVEIIARGAIQYAGRVVYSTSYVEIIDGGRSWQLGQLIRFSGSVLDTIARVSDIDDVGTVRAIEVVEYGYQHTNDQQITITPNSIETTTATFVLKSDVVAKIPGRWASDAGTISHQDIRIQDSYYYQQFSYEIETPLPPNTYLKAANTLHPAGMLMFTKQSLEKTIQLNLKAVTSFPYKAIGVFEIITPDELAVSLVTKLVADSISLNDLTVRSAKKALSETVLSSEANSKTAVKPRTDSLTTSDTNTKYPIKARAESLTPSDTNTKVALKPLSDTSSVTELALRTTIKPASDIITSGDNLNRTTVKIRIETVTPADQNIKVTVKPLVETSLVVDATRLTTIKPFTESAMISEGLKVSYLKLAIDAVTPTESFIRVINKASIQDIVTISPGDTAVVTPAAPYALEVYFAEEYNSVQTVLTIS